MAGALALVLAGFGSVAVSSRTDSDTLAAANYQSIAPTYAAKAASGDSVDVSRSFDRQLAQQAEQQAQQQQKALAQLASRAQSSANRLKLNQWVLPVTGYQLTARFGQSSGLWANTHTGLDFAGPSGSTIVSVAAGTVKSTGYEGAYGNRTVITLNDGTDVWYCHQSRIAVQPGEKVGPGDVIGYTGATGNVTGPHLHLEIHPSGGNDASDAVDPEPVLREHGVNP